MDGQIMNFYVNEEIVKSLTSEEYDKENPEWNGEFESGDMVEINGENMVIDSVQSEFAGEEIGHYIINLYLKESY